MTFCKCRYLLRPRSNKLDEQLLAFRNFLCSIVENHRNQFDQSDLKDYIDVYLDEIRQVEGTELASSINKDNLISTISQLFGAGSETTVTTIRWAILYMMGYPEIQRKIQQEIDNAVGRDRLPNFLDKDQMPYTEATIMEVQRIASIAPLGLPHRALEDTTLFGYTIPQNAIIMSNLWGIHHDPEIWKDPETFSPERFLDGDKLKNQPQMYMPFSTGTSLFIKHGC